MIRKCIQYFMLREMKKAKVWARKPGKVRRLSVGKSGMRDKLEFIADPGWGRGACAIDQSIDYVGDCHVNHPWLPTHPWVTQHNTFCCQVLHVWPWSTVSWGHLFFEVWVKLSCVFQFAFAVGPGKEPRPSHVCCQVWMCLCFSLFLYSMHDFFFQPQWPEMIPIPRLLWGVEM